MPNHVEHYIQNVMDKDKKCTNCGKSFSTKLGLTSLCGDCEDRLKEKELDD